MFPPFLQLAKDFRADCHLFNSPTAAASSPQFQAISAFSTALTFIFLSMISPCIANELGTDTSTFSATVSSTCSMPLGDTTQAMSYSSGANNFYKTVDFSLTANQAVRLSVSSVSIVEEPQNINSRYAWARVERPQSAGSNTTVLPGPSDATTGDIDSGGVAFDANNQSGISTEYSLVFNVGTTNRSNNRHLLLPGQYIYQVTVTCLL